MSGLYLSLEGKVIADVAWGKTPGGAVCGHLVMREQPEASNHLIEEFLHGQSARTPWRTQ